MPLLLHVGDWYESTPGNTDLKANFCIFIFKINGEWASMKY